MASQIRKILKVTLLLDVQLQDRPLIFAETIPAPRVQAPIPEVHLVAVDVSHLSTTGPEPFLDATLLVKELVAHFARNCPLVSKAVTK